MLNYLLILILLVFTACSFNNVTQIEPVSVQKSQALRLAITLGTPLDSATEGDECAQFISTLPSTFKAEKISVPENWNQPDSKKINVFYYYRLEKNKPAVVFYNGGPSADSHSSYQILEKINSSKEYSFIYIDQRGTGCSDPYPTDSNLETLERLKSYGSRSIVQDSEAIRTKLLGVKTQWKIFGQSFGGLISHRYLSMTEAAHGVQSAHIHGYSITQSDVEFIALRIKSQKRVLEDYFSEYPQDRAQLINLRQLIPADRCFTDQKSTLCGSNVIDSAAILLGFRTSWPSLHKYLSELITADKQLNEALLKKFVSYLVFGVYANNGLAANVVSKIDMSGGHSDQESCQLAQEMLVVQGEKPQEWLINECRVLENLTNSEWTELLATIKSGDDLLLSDIKQNLQRLSTPTYLYSGQKDVFVPTETFVHEVNYLGDLIKYTNFLETGHEGFYKEDQIWKELSH